MFGWALGWCYVFRSCFCSCYGCFQKKSVLQHTSKEICIVITRVEKETSARPHIRSANSTTLVFVAMMTTAKLSLSHCNMVCAAIQVLRSRDTLALINQNKESIHDPIQSGHSWKLNCTVQNSLKAGVHEESRQAQGKARNFPYKGLFWFPFPR
jgi:hypothetical protein